MDMRRAPAAAIGCVFSAAVAQVSVGPAPDACERVRSLTLANVTITRAENLSASQRPYCSVAATLKPSPDSNIAIAVWLPQDNWNEKFLGVGNGGWSGSIPQAALTEGLRRGYAVGATDTGHTGGSASFALGHPEKLIDFAHRSVHEMTVAAKAIAAAYYGRAPRRSYWNGCSAGGRQAMKEAQMFPADYDGIVAGSPGLDWAARSAQAVRVAHALNKDNARLTPAALQLVHEAVMRACDASDGLHDGLIADPSRCAFDPGTLLCRTADASGCLTAAQVESVRAVYAPVRNRAGNREIPGLAPGSERGWTDLGWTASARAAGQDHYRFIIFKDPVWTIDRFDPAADTFRLDEGESAALNAVDTNLEPFFSRGGKLLQYHGWSDPQISPLTSVAYYRRVLERFGDKITASYRLFMAPGMAHCGGGDGPNQFDALAALEQWVEQGSAPASIPARHATSGRTRPLCPYPQIAKYTGTGSMDSAANFVCATR